MNVLKGPAGLPLGLATLIIRAVGWKPHQIAKCRIRTDSQSVKRIATAFQVRPGEVSLALGSQTPSADTV